jgi:hypothetical protein
VKQKSAAKQLVPVCSSWVDGVHAYSYNARRSSRCDICETGSSGARRTGKSVRQCDGKLAATDESRSRASP